MTDKLDELYETLCVGTEYEVKATETVSSENEIFAVGGSSYHPGKDISVLIDKLISINLSMRNRYVSLYRNVSFSQFAAQFCAVKFYSGRGMGTSTYVKHRAGIHDLVIVSSQHQVSEYSANRCVVIAKPDFTVASSMRFAHRIFNRIYVLDPSDSIFNNDQGLYDTLAKDPSAVQQTFIFLGY